MFLWSRVRWRTRCGPLQGLSHRVLRRQYLPFRLLHPRQVLVLGRPPALKAKDLAAAKALLKDPEITVVEVAKRLGVAASTLYRHLPRARTAALEA